MTPNTVRAELLAALAQLSHLRPEWRLGQTLANLATTAGRMGAGAVWDMEDDEALNAAKELIGQYVGNDVLAADEAPIQRPVANA